MNWRLATMVSQQVFYVGCLGFLAFGMKQHAVLMDMHREEPRCFGDENQAQQHEKRDEESAVACLDAVECSLNKAQAGLNFLDRSFLPKLLQQLNLWRDEFDACHLRTCGKGGKDCHEVEGNLPNADSDRDEGAGHLVCENPCARQQASSRSKQVVDESFHFSSVSGGSDVGLVTPSCHREAGSRTGAA